MLTLQSCINSLQQGGQEDIKKAKKEVRHIWRKLPASNMVRKKFVETYLEEMERFDKIKYKRNQLAFISSLRYPFLEAGGKQDYFLACRDFVLKQIQHPSGHIRQAIVHASDWLVLSLNLGPTEVLRRNSSDIKKSEEHRVWFCQFAEKVDKLLEDYEDGRLRRYKYIDNMPSGVYKSLQFLMYNLMRTEYHRNVYREYCQKDRPGSQDQDRQKEVPVIPKWMDCTWKRMPCGNQDCPICGQDDDSSEAGPKFGSAGDIDSVLEDVVSDLRDTYSDVQDFAARQGVSARKKEQSRQAPQPEDFPLYNQLKMWRDDTLAVAEQAADDGSFWPATDPGQDLLWYANVLLGKVYRQLCSRWYMDEGEDYEPVDYDYTGHVLVECMAYIKTSLQDLIGLDVAEKDKLNLILLYFPVLEKKISEI